MRTPGRLRYAGLAATVLLAAGAFGAGARPAGDPAPRFASAWLAGTTTGYRMGLLAWVCGLVLLGVVWWRLAAWLPDVGARWLLITGALWALPLLLAPPLASRDVYAYACQGALWADGQDPYVTGIAPGCPWLDAVPPLWHDTPTPYGPLAIGISGGAAAVARALPLAGSGQLLAAVTVLRLLAVAGVALAAGCALRLARRRRPDGVSAAAWLAALSPVVLIHAVSGAHHDALLTGLMMAALAVALPTPPAMPGRAGPGWGRMLAVGALLGLAAAVKVTAVVAAPFAVLLLARPLTASTRLPSGAAPARLTSGPASTQPTPGSAPAQPTAESTPVRRASGRAVARAAAGVAGGLGGAFAVCTLVTGLSLGWVGALRGTGSLVQWTSPPTAVGMAFGYPLRALGWSEGYSVAVALARAAGVLALALCLAALLRLSWRATRERTILLCCGAASGAVALLSPVFYPWYALAPLAILAAAALGNAARPDSATTPGSGAAPGEVAGRWLGGVAIGLSALILPQGLGVAVLTKFPGAYLVTAALAGLVWYFSRGRRAGRATPTSTG